MSQIWYICSYMATYVRRFPLTQITLPRQVGLIVAPARKAAGLTQAELARRAGVSRQLVNRLEVGTANGIAFDKLLSVLKVVDCGLDIYPLSDDPSIILKETCAPPAPSPPVLDDWNAYKLDESLFDDQGALANDA